MRKDSIRRQSVRERGEREENHNVLLLAVPLAGPPIFRIHTTEPTSIPILLSLYFFFAQRAITKMDREQEGRPSLPLHAYRHVKGK